MSKNILKFKPKDKRAYFITFSFTSVTFNMLKASVTWKILIPATSTQIFLLFLRPLHLSQTSTSSHPNIFILVISLPEGQTGKAFEPSNNRCSFYLLS